VGVNGEQLVSIGGANFDELALPLVGLQLPHPLGHALASLSQLIVSPRYRYCPRAAANQKVCGASNLDLKTRPESALALRCSCPLRVLFSQL
jgi:hypothetical protein